MSRSILENALVQSTLSSLIHDFLHALLIVGPSKFNTNYLRQTDGDQFYVFSEHADLLKNSNDSKRRSRQLRHKMQLQHLYDAITYPPL